MVVGQRIDTSHILQDVTMATDSLLLLTLAAALFATGLVAGTLAGLLGVGGGIVMVPALYYLFGFIDIIDENAIMHMSVGTSLAAMIPTSVRSAMGHRAKGNVDEDLFKRWMLPIALGAIIGIIIAAYVKGPVLITVFAVFALLVSLHMGFGNECWRLADTLPGRVWQSIIAFTIACISVMMGIGGGTFGVPALTLFNYPIHRAVGTAAAMGIIIAIIGGIGFILGGLGTTGRPPYSLGYASLVGVAMIVPATFISAPWGVALANILSRFWLRRAFALFLGLTGLRMAYSLF
jgi:uncharacterized protein